MLIEVLVRLQCILYRYSNQHVVKYEGELIGTKVSLNTLAARLR